MSHFDRLQEFYRAGSVPWDQQLPPPEVLATTPTLLAGRALDLGCGFGRAALYLASLGWQVDGVDFIPQAITEANARASRAGLADKARFHQGSVTQLGFLSGAYDFALDVGCVHGLDEADLESYHLELSRLLRPGAVYLLFAHLTTPNPNPDTRRWLDEARLRRVFETGFALERVEYGQTQVRDQAPWRSGWFWFKRI
jgi:SAM-dependent methyltransferase